MSLDPEMLRRSLCAHFGGTNSWQFETVADPSGSKYRLCILRAINADSGRDVAIKANTGRDRNEEQFNALEAFYNDGVESVRPFYIDSSKLFFVMEWVDAPLLAQQLGGTHHEELIAKAGRWLSKMQNLTENNTIDASNIRKPKLKRLRGDQAVQKLYKTLNKSLGDPKVLQKTPARLHGDFIITNVFLSRNRLLGFDAQVDAYGIPFHDASRFLLSLARARHDASHAGNSWQGSAEQDRQSFFDGYGAIHEEDLWLFDLLEDGMYFNSWRRLRSRNVDTAGIQYFDQELGKRGLLGDRGETTRPGRLVKNSENNQEIWTRDVPYGRPRSSKSFVSQVKATKLSDIGKLIGLSKKI